LSRPAINGAHPHSSPGTRSPHLTRQSSAAVSAINDASQFIGTFDADESEAIIAVNPTNTNNLFVLSNAFAGEGTVGPAGGLMASYSFDGGATWHPHYIATGNDHFIPGCCDGSVAFDRFGNLWFSYLDQLGDTDETVVMLSTDGGITYHQVADFLDASNLAIDQPKLTVGSNSVWVVWDDVADTTEPDGVLVTASAFFNGLGSWQGFFGAASVPFAPNGTFEAFGKIAVGPNDQVVASFQDPNSGEGPDSIWTTLDAQGTRGSFATPTLVTTTNVGSFATPSSQPDRMVDAESEPAYDRSGGAFNGRLYLVYSDRPTTLSNSFDIFVRHSDNDGATWSAPVRVTDDTTGQPKILPRIKVDPVTGDVAVSWLDSRNDDTGKGAEEFVAFSTDGGQTFSQNIQVATALSNASLADNVNNYGDYEGLDFYNGVAYMAWPDNSTDISSVNLDAPNSFDIAEASVSVSSATFGGGGGGGGGNLANDIYDPNGSSDKAHDFGTLTGSQNVPNLTINTNSDGTPNVDWFKWTMGSGGTFTATETTDSGGPLELHIFKLINGGLTDEGDATDSSSVKTLTTSVSANDVMYVEVKGQNTSPGVFTTGSYHLDVSIA
jgi:hypothetical protein